MSSRVLAATLAGVSGLLVAVGFVWLTRSSGTPPPDQPSPTQAAPASAPGPAPSQAAEPISGSRGSSGRRSVKAPAAAPPAPAAESAPPVTGTLIITSDVPDTSVFVDRVYLGSAPVTAADLPLGAHQLRLAATGYEGIAETVDVAPGTRDIAIRFKEIRLDQKLPVVHKHVRGSCAGTIVATPQGVQYVTDHQDDAFSVGLMEMETFEVDYLAKNLRVKVRRGRTFNFTDPDGNADRLFTFHETVEKVRKRIAAGR
jgi:hypothetical protein